MYMRYVIAGIVALLVTGCASTPYVNDPSLWEYNRGNLPTPDLKLDIAGLGPCTDNPDRTLQLDSKQPTIILTHGCFSSSGRFRALAEVFAFHGQQTACFTYDDRDKLTKSADELIDAVKQLGRSMQNKNITIIGHSQGGLISRNAMTKDRKLNLVGEDLNLELVTISAPFNGIATANHCGSTLLQIVTLGLIVPICYAISGDKWYEITKHSDFIQNPGTLVPQIDSYLKIVTDETNTCRRFDNDGICAEDDYVFSVPEQYYSAVDNDKRITNIELNAGHVEIVGDQKVVPNKLIAILQQQGIMKQTSAEQKLQLEQLLAQLYGLTPAMR